MLRCSDELISTETGCLILGVQYGLAFREFDEGLSDYVGSRDKRHDNFSSGGADDY